MKILQIAARLPYPPSDGGATGIMKITEGLSHRGHNITLVTFPEPDPVTTHEAKAVFSKFCRLELVSKPLPGRSATLIRTLFRGAYPIARRMMPEMFRLLEQLIRSD